MRQVFLAAWKNCKHWMPLHKDFMKQNPKSFCKAFINTLPNCDVITSNISETFNGYICKARWLLIIDMLEWIRTSLMERMYDKSKMMNKCSDEICPRIGIHWKRHNWGQGIAL